MKKSIHVSGRLINCLSESDICICHKLRNRNLPFFLKFMTITKQLLCYLILTDFRRFPRDGFYLTMFSLQIKCHKKFRKCRMAGCLHVSKKTITFFAIIFFLERSAIFDIFIGLPIQTHKIFGGLDNMIGH